MNYFWPEVNYLDLLIAVPLAWGAFNGFRKGFVIELASLFALILGIYGAVKFSSITAIYLNENVDWSHQAVKLISFILTFLAIVIIVHLIARLIQKVVKLVALNMINRISGLFFGIVKYLIIVSALLFVVDSINERYPFLDAELKKESLFYQPIATIIPLIYPLIKESVKEGQSIIAFIPGNVMPSKYSIKAPPPVET